MRFWPHKATDESAPIEPMTVEQALKERPDKIELLEVPKTLPQAMKKYHEEIKEKKEAPKNIIPDPEPNLSTKPKDIVGYCFGYACPKKHVFDFFDSITPDQRGVRKPCQDCGGVSRPAVIKRTAEALWVDCQDLWNKCVYGRNGPAWIWSHYSRSGRTPVWNHHEFVHYLDPVKPRPRRRKK